MWFEGQNNFKSKDIDWKRCQIAIDGGQCRTTRKGWLNPKYHEYIQLPDSKIICKNCYNNEGEAKGYSPKKQPKIAAEHDDIAYTWDIKRTRARTFEKSGSDTFTCTLCNRRGDFYFFENFDCPKRKLEQDIKEDTKVEGNMTFD